MRRFFKAGLVGMSVLMLATGCSKKAETDTETGAASASDAAETTAEYVAVSYTHLDVYKRQVYYCPGTDVEEYNCYLMVWEGKMFVLNIEKGYDSYVEMIMAYIE